jgi:hypothetical protein
MDKKQDLLKAIVKIEKPWPRDAMIISYITARQEK